MSKKHPTPWKFDIDDADEPIKDANGGRVFTTDDGFLGPDDDTIREIVDAVNEYSPVPKTEMLADAVSANIALVDERDRLRDLVKRMIPFVEKCHSDALDLSKTIKGICALKGVDTSEIDRINSEHDALIAEARAAIAEDKP